MIERFLPEGWKLGDEYKVRLPTYINVSKKVTKPLNLNVYRNLHHHSLNTQKQTFHDLVKPLLGHIPQAEKIWIHYTIFAPRNGRLDTMNVGSIVDKYFSDTLVEAKKIMDDHFGHVVFVSFSFGGVCKLEGHAIATINILEEETPMRILLDENDIQNALDNYVLNELGLSGATGVKIEATADGNISAEVLMGETTTLPTKIKNKGGRPAGSKNKTKPAPEKDAPEEEVTPDVETGNDADKDGSSGTDTGSGESAETGAKDGATAVSSEKASTASAKKKGNLFGDEESQSSDSAENTSTTSNSAEETSPVVVPASKKSSIFDVN